jgi:3-deoxy-manno-octulosonate cytidylyltransferase (CMP-KDO synthetase)
MKTRMLETVAVIPARFQSTRFPGKPLARLAGKPLIQHVYERCTRAQTPARVLVATDDDRIVSAVREFGGEAVLTSLQHASGTDRVAEVARKVEAEIFVNVQGDEPLVDPRDIDALVEDLRGHPSAGMTTLRRPVHLPRDLEDPNVVKVVCDSAGNALYFSRSPIPHLGAGCVAGAFRHLGLYAYRKAFLLEFNAAVPGALELAEGLEQLRVLEAGKGIRVLDARGESIGVDTPQDLKRVQDLLDEVPN